jgi:hypothetical protein
MPELHPPYFLIAAAYALLCLAYAIAAVQARYRPRRPALRVNAGRLPSRWPPCGKPGAFPSSRDLARGGVHPGEQRPAAEGDGEAPAGEVPGLRERLHQAARR